MKALVTAVLLVAPALASGQGSGEIPRDALRGRIFSLDGRHELRPVLGIAVSDAYRRDWLFGVAYSGHISEEFALSVRGLYALGVDTAMTDAIRAADPARGSALALRKLQLLTTAEAEFKPIYGKFMLLGKLLVRYDTSLTVGVGVSRFDSVGFDFAWSFGIGARFFISRRVGVEIGLRDYVLRKVDPATGGKPPFHDVTVTFGPTFFL